MPNFIKSTPWQSFWRGYASVFALFVPRRIEVPDYAHGPERDAAAFAEDWRRVGDCLRCAMGKVGAGE